jgi:hypothetical protein
MPSMLDYERLVREIEDLRFELKLLKEREEEEISRWDMIESILGYDKKSQEIKNDKYK